MSGTACVEEYRNEMMCEKEKNKQKYIPSMIMTLLTNRCK